MAILRFFTIDTDIAAHRQKILKQLQNNFPNVATLQAEKCYHVETTVPIQIKSKAESLLRWLLKHPQGDRSSLHLQSLLPAGKNETILIEVGPRFNFSTPFSTNCVNICQNVGLTQVIRLESSVRYLIGYTGNIPDTDKLMELLSDRMTECRYTRDNLPTNSFNEQLPQSQESWYFVPVMERGRKALEEVNDKLGLSFSDWDLEYYTNLFEKTLKRNPTTVELFDCAQSNSEHSRHWFFRGKIIVDGIEQPQSLIRMIMGTQSHTNANNTIKFSDNSSAIKGFKHLTIRPQRFNGPGAIAVQSVESDLIFTAETHNMPTAVAPFSGASTGTGGRLRDVQGVGRGGLPIAGTAGYCVGCLNIPGFPQSYENPNYVYPSSFSKPLKILIEASNGASDYGNKFGEPLITGFVCSYGLTNAQGDRDEYVKPIMFSGGMGVMESSMRQKLDPKHGMLLAKIGGPVYRIGVGGGAASSVEVQGSNDSALDFNAVQRGDAEMENKLNRVVRACIEMGDRNPILAIHDQGAGGNGNVLKELVEPGFAGAIIFSKEFQLGDPTINALELWGAEYQENDAILCSPQDRTLLETICARERCPICFVGIVTGDGRVSLLESSADFDKALNPKVNRTDFGPMPFDLELKHVLGEMPKREYHLQRLATHLLPLQLEHKFDYAGSLERVLSLVSVGSKRYLTNKVDRCVTGLIAQQQCVGPLHTPLADFALVAVSHYSKEGLASSLGTQPIKGLLSAGAMARMSVAEAISNLVFVKITELADVKCSGNWMWAAKLPGEGARMFDACQEMCQIMKELKIAVDGGKDSLSMAAKIGEKTVKSPGTLVISTYAPCPDINVKVTPDIKGSAHGLETVLLWINIEGKFRLGGSALAQVHSQQGNECPNVLRTDVLSNAFKVTQKLLAEGKLLAGHDISDGGLLICLLEMAFAGLSGLQVNLTNVVDQIPHKSLDEASRAIQNPELAILYAEECGWVLEIHPSSLSEVQAAFSAASVPNYVIGCAKGYGLDSTISVSAKGRTLLHSNVKTLFKQWERISFELEKLQTNTDCAIEEFNTLDYRTGPKYFCEVDLKPELILKRATRSICVAVLREEGVNSDREMMASLLKANFEVHDVTMSDLLEVKTTLDRYRGVIFPGGFSYADTLGSAKGWAANIMFSEKLSPQFQTFRQRKDTFSLGICNGCQLMSLIGWVGSFDERTAKQIVDVPDVALLRNKSERFECRWATLRIASSKAMMLRKLSGSVLGCWVAHGEGRFSFRTPEILHNLKEKQCVTLHYVDDNAKPTEVYPMNPNGSAEGIAGLCSPDGRHLAMMPHPERCHEMFEWPYISPGFQITKGVSPWQVMFNTANEWCTAE